MPRCPERIAVGHRYARCHRPPPGSTASAPSGRCCGRWWPTPRPRAFSGCGSINRQDPRRRSRLRRTTAGPSMSHRRQGRLHGARPAGRSRRLASGASASRPRMPPRWRRKPRLRSRPEYRLSGPAGPAPHGLPGPVTPRAAPVADRRPGQGGLPPVRRTRGPHHAKGLQRGRSRTVDEHHWRCDTCRLCPLASDSVVAAAGAPIAQFWTPSMTDVCRQPEPAEVGGEEGDDLCHNPDRQSHRPGQTLPARLLASARLNDRTWERSRPRAGRPLGRP
jgi:hypothetical protein